LDVGDLLARRTGANAPDRRLPAIKIENPGEYASLHAFVGELIAMVSVKAGRECFVTPSNAAGTVRFGNCYVIEGLATAVVGRQFPGGACLPARCWSVRR
jgi:hypothetical protein